MCVWVGRICDSHREYNKDINYEREQAMSVLREASACMKDHAAYSGKNPSGTATSQLRFSLCLSVSLSLCLSVSLSLSPCALSEHESRSVH